MESEPQLDDLVRLEETGQLARETISDSKALDSLVQHMRAELFIFELDYTCPPKLVNGEYDCLGFIYCRLKAHAIAFDTFMQQLQDLSAFLQMGHRNFPLNVERETLISANGCFSLQAKFRAPSQDEPFTVSLYESPTEGCNISGSPLTLRKLIDHQQLIAPFGTVDHRKRAMKCISSTVSQAKRRRTF